MPRRTSVAATVALSDATAALRNEESAKLFIQASEKQWFRIENLATEDSADVYITDAIGTWFGVDAGEFVRELTAIDKSKINLHLSSPGGAVFDSVMIYNALRTHKAEITVLVEGIAASSASFIAQAGDKVVMQTGAMMMIHDAAGIVMGNAKDMRDTADVLDKVSNNIASIYAKRAGEDVAFWRALMQEEVWYTAQEAVDAGLADTVDEAQAADVTDKLLLPVFNYKGRGEAPDPKQVRQLIFNRLKETLVSGTPKAPTKPANQADDDKQGTESAAAAQPEDQTPAAAPPGTEEPNPNPEGQPGAPATGAQLENRSTATAFIINGKAETDPVKVQAYISGLEGSATETRIQNRKNFIKSLVDGNKLLASQVTATEEFILGTADEPGLTDKQYEKWVASWDAAPVIGSLNRGVGDGNSSERQPINEAEDLKDKLDVAREIVRNHKRTNMPQATLEATGSWKLLKAHDALDTI